MSIQTHGGQDNNVLITFKEDFSVTTNLLGCNKNGINEIRNNLTEIEHYPPQTFEPYVTNLTNFLYKYHDTNNKIILGNGASELIDLVIRNVSGDSWKPGKSPVQFLEYERSATLMKKEKKGWDDIDTNLTCIINPNNPTGDYLPIHKLKEYILQNCNSKSKLHHVIVDESMQPWYGENWRNDSLLSQTDWIQDIMDTHNICVYIIHSWTKIFSCTGIRYGSIICPSNNIYNTIKAAQVPWTVNILALKYVDYCITDEQYFKDTWVKTKELRKYQLSKLNNIFPKWTCYGEDFLSWIWIDTHSDNIAELAYKLAKYNGTPIRHGKMGYNMSSYIRIAVRKKKYFDDLIVALLPLKELNSPTIRTPVHIDIDNSIIVEFKWINLDLLKAHEEYINERHSKLLEYVKSIDTAISLPAIIICSKTHTIIDGHHRYSVMKKLGIKKIPCILINYKSDKIIVNPYKNISKETVLNSALNEKYLPPKSTAHMVIDKHNSFHPIQVISPLVFINVSDK